MATGGSYNNNTFTHANVLQQLLDGIIDRGNIAHKNTYNGMVSIGKSFTLTKVAVYTPACIAILMIARNALEKALIYKERLVHQHEAYGTVTRERLQDVSRQVFIYTLLLVIALVVLSTIWLPFIIARLFSDVAAFLGASTILSYLS